MCGGTIHGVDSDLKNRLLYTSSGASFMVKGRVNKACVQSVLVYGSETWPVKMENMQRLKRTERMMVK